jgi:Na+/H+ antiporter NhaD/arsenite permease-like protein
VVLLLQCKIQTFGMNSYFLIAIFCVLVVYFFLITEKVNKVITVLTGASVLILLNVFQGEGGTSQHNGLGYISRNLDILAFIIGMTILVGVVKKSGAFEVVALWLVKLVKGQPKALLVAISYLTFVLTIFLSNIPAVLIVSPVLLVLIKQLKLPYLPYIFAMITMANIGGAVTPISDPTTYYQATKVGLSFAQVFLNSGLIAILLSFVVVAYTLLVFKKDLEATVVDPNDVKTFKPLEALQDRKILKIGLPILFVSIFLMIAKEFLNPLLNMDLESGTIAVFSAMLCLLIFKIDIKEALEEMIDWQIIFFFVGLFVVIGSLEFTGVTAAVADSLIKLTGGNQTALIFLISLGSGIISIFLDNVPYNIAMVSSVLELQNQGVFVEPLWWALNLGTSIGGAGSVIGAACNVVVMGEAEKEGFHPKFGKYLKIGLPLVVINCLITFFVLILRYR